MSSLAPYRFLTQDRNLIASAVLAATNPKHSSAIRRDLSASSRAGNGRAVLSGPYEGESDTRISVRVVAGGGTPRASTPVFVGVGSGGITGPTVAAGATSQTYTLTLTDTGTATEAASVLIDGYRVSARDPGADGNSITIDVDESGLTYTATDYSLLRAIAKGADNQTGQEWDWGLPAGADDAVPATAPRLCIGGDRATVYRAWKSYTGGAWKYHLLPAAERDYPAGSRIYAVTGARQVTVSDGADDEVYSSLVTLRDLLMALDASSIVAPSEIPSAAQTVENVAAVCDMRLRTEGRIDHSDFVNSFAGTEAATEIIEAKCYAVSADLDAGIGRERWRLKGSVSGDLGLIRTGQPYTAPGGKFGLTIPTRLPDGYGSASGKMGATVAYAEREEDEVQPPICVRALRLGPNAENGTYVWKYTKRPVGGAECDCDQASYVRLAQIEKCLGIEIVEEGMGTRTGGYYQRSQAVAAWHREAVGSNAAIDANGELRAAIHDMDLADKGRAIMLVTLQRLYDEGDLSPLAWAANTAMPVDTIRQPATANGYRYVCTVAGTTGASAPTWPTTVGSTVTDGTVTWRCLSKLPTALFDALLAAIDADFVALEAFAATDWSESIDPVAYDTAYAKGDLVTNIFGQVWVCVSAGTTYDENSGATLLYHDNVTSASAGTISPAGEPVFMLLGKLPSTGDANTTNLGVPGIANDPTTYSRKWQAWADEVLVAAELDPNFDGASSAEAGVCWRDVGDAYWWAPQGDHSAHLPAFTNHEYVSCYVACDGSGDVIPTHGFSMAIVVADACIGHLKEGDTVTVNINIAGFSAVYKVGDLLTMATVAGAPLSLTGGVTGTDAYTWAVRRSVDGPGTAYTQDLADPEEYDDGDVAFTLTAGGVQGRVGDQWTFAVSSDAWQWREGSGSWSTSADIGDDGSLPDGLAVEWEAGPDPSFVADDLAVWDVLQPYAVSSAVAPDDEAMAWDGDGCVITAALTGAVDSIAIARHTLPPGATVTVSDGDDLDESIPWRPGPMVLLLDAPLTDPTLTITIEDAPGGAIGWLWAGQAVAVLAQAKQTRETRWSMTPGEGANPSGLLQGYGVGFGLDFPVFLRAQDMGALVAGFQAHKEAGDLPLIFVPHAARVGDAALVRAPDSVTWGEYREWLYDSGSTERHISATMELSPWLTS